MSDEQMELLYLYHLECLSENEMKKQYLISLHGKSLSQTLPEDVLIKMGYSEVQIQEMKKQIHG